MTDETTDVTVVPAEASETPFRLPVPEEDVRTAMFMHVLRFLRDGASWNRSSAEDFNFQTGVTTFCVGGAIAKATTGIAGVMNFSEDDGDKFTNYLIYANYAGRVLQAARGYDTSQPDRSERAPYFYPYVSNLVSWNDGLTSHEWPLLRGLLEACRDGRPFDLDAARASLGSLA